MFYINKKLLNNKKSYLKNNLDTIESTKIAKKIDKNDEKLEILAICSLFVESRLEEDSFTSTKRELIVESLFSQFEFIQDRFGFDINYYLDVLDRELRNISQKPIENIGGKGQYMGSTKKIEITNDMEDDDFLIAFTHELNHCFVNKLNTKKELIKNNKFRFSSFEEMQNQFLTLKILEDNFPQSIREKEYIVSFIDSNNKLRIQAEDDRYVEIVQMGKILNKIFGDDLIKVYYEDSFDTFRKRLNNSEDFSRAMNLRFESLSGAYFIFGGADNIKLKDYLKLEDACASIIARYIKENDLDDKEILKIKTIVLENPRILIPDNINLNERMINQIDSILENNKKLEKMNISFIKSQEKEDIVSSFFRVVNDVLDTKNGIEEKVRETFNIEK